MKRLLICSIGGVIAGILCSFGGLLSGNIESLTFSSVASLFVDRIMLGFVIGISRLKVNYLLHGALIGFLVSLIISISFLNGNILGFLFFTGAGVIYGLLIELFTTKIFHAGVSS